MEARLQDQLDALKKQVTTLTSTLIGVLISVTTAAVLLALNLGVTGS